MVRRHLTWILLALLTASSIMLVGAYGYAHIIVHPKIGFSFNPFTGMIMETLPEDEPISGQVKPGDQILAIRGISFQDYSFGVRTSLFALVSNQNELPLTVERNGEIIQVEQPIARLTPGESAQRAVWFIPAVLFLLFDVIVLLSLRPTGTCWVLFTLAYSLTAVWLAGMVVMPFNIMGSSTLIRVIIWLCLPIYLHLSWCFPKPLAPLRITHIMPVYLAGALLAYAEIARWLPPSAFLIGLNFSLIGSLGLTLMHYKTHPEFRRDMFLLGAIMTLLILPTAIGSTLNLHTRYSATQLLLLIGVPGIPPSVLLFVYRRRLGGLELRANETFTGYLFTLVLFVLSVSLTLALNLLFPIPELDPAFTILLAILMGLFGAMVFPYFSKWVRSRLLDIPFPSEQLLKEFSSEIVTSLEKDTLSDLLVNKVFPSMLIREAALLQVDEAFNLTPVAIINVTHERLPNAAEVKEIFQTASQRRGTNLTGQLLNNWVRLALHLKVMGHPIGICLLGRRDPDDLYPNSDVITLQSLMDQTALALYNIEQSERIMQFHKANIERQEAEVHRLALELHDDVLGQLALIAMNSPEEFKNDAFQQSYEKAANHIRGIINGLRPTMLSYGLRIALQELVDNIQGQMPDPPIIEIDIPEEDTIVRYPDEMEMHLYRIVQQACQNAIRHGMASRILISGTLQPSKVLLRIEDNGVGFEISEHPDLRFLLANQHFGLAGMYERTALIKGTLRVESSPGKGAKVQVEWNPPGK